MDDDQARRLCATENLQRSDLSAIEEVSALVDIIDVDLLKAFPGYSSYGNTSAERVRFVLMKLDSDRRTGTDYFSSKFTGKMKLIDKVKEIFNGLPKPKELITFTINDLPLLTSIDNEVQAVAIHRSNNQNRDATPGQKAMATAMAFPDPAKPKRKAMFPEETSDAGFNKATFSKARYVLRNSPMVEGERYQGDGLTWLTNSMSSY